jgi:hypothetical protein
LVLRRNPIQPIRGLSLSHTWRYLPLGQQLAREFGQQWNPELNDRVPVRLLREENLEDVGPEILGAARAFLAGG